MKNNQIDISVIIPIYNAEKYIYVCIDSLMHQGELHLEIILVDDGSTDQSGAIVDKCAEKDNRIKVIHQVNGGASAARNTGLNVARGEYIAFLDSDDWIKEKSLPALYHQAISYQADVVMGHIWLCHQDGSIDKPFKQVSGEFLNNTVSGKEGFIWLVKNRFYLPTPVQYIYKREYLQKIQACFEEGIMHEDELWTPIVLYQAEKMVISDIAFYYYRQNEESVMHTTSLSRRLASLFKVTDRLMESANRFDFSGENEKLKNWWYVNVFRLYAMAFILLPNIKDSSYKIPKHHLDRFWQDCWQMIPDALQRCRDYHSNAGTGLRRYIDWVTSDWVASVNYQVKTGKRLMLIYNTIDGKDISLSMENVPNNWVITTDRRYFQQADAVVFYLPNLQQEVENDLDKPEGQIWISWYLESEKEDPLTSDPEIRDIFDVWISHQPGDEQREHLLVRLCRSIHE